MPLVEIERLRAREEKDGFIRLPPVMQPPHLRRPRPGETVRVKDGPFVQQLGICQSSQGPERSKVLLEFLGGKVPVLLRNDNLDVV